MPTAGKRKFRQAGLDRRRTVIALEDEFDISIGDAAAERLLTPRMLPRLCPQQGIDYHHHGLPQKTQRAFNSPDCANRSMHNGGWKTFRNNSRHESFPMPCVSGAQFSIPSYWIGNQTPAELDPAEAGQGHVARGSARGQVCRHLCRPQFQSAGLFLNIHIGVAFGGWRSWISNFQARAPSFPQNCKTSASLPAG